MDAEDRVKRMGRLHVQYLGAHTKKGGIRIRAAHKVKRGRMLETEGGTCRCEEEATREEGPRDGKAKEARAAPPRRRGRVHGHVHVHVHVHVQHLRVGEGAGQQAVLVEAAPDATDADGAPPVASVNGRGCVYTCMRMLHVSCACVMCMCHVHVSCEWEGVRVYVHAHASCEMCMHAREGATHRGSQWMRPTRSLRIAPQCERWSSQTTSLPESKAERPAAFRSRAAIARR